MGKERGEGKEAGGREVGGSGGGGGSERKDVGGGI